MNPPTDKQTIMYQLTETSKYMMSFVIVTRENHVIFARFIRRIRRKGD